MTKSSLAVHMHIMMPSIVQLIPIHYCRDHGSYLPSDPTSGRQVTELKRGMRLQVFTVSPTDEPAYTCFETGGPTPVPCTTVISTQPDNSASTQLFMGGEAPADAPALDVSTSSSGLTVAVYQSDTRIAHAIVPLDQVWEVLLSCIKHYATACCDAHSNKDRLAERALGHVKQGV